MAGLAFFVLSWPGLSRPSTPWQRRKAWMPGTRPGMTAERSNVQSRHHLAQRGDLELILVVANRFGDEACGDRRAVVVQDRYQPHRVDAILVDDQRAKLGVAVLFDHIDEVVVGDE